MSAPIEIRPDLEEAAARCEERLSGYRSHILDAGRRVEDPHRRRAFLLSYYWLRIAGPQCLPRPVGRSRTLEAAENALRSWRDTARLCHQGQPDPSNPMERGLADAMERFNLPIRPWIDLEEGLQDLLRGEPVPDMATFIHRGRRIALPAASVFFRILCARRGHHRYHLGPELDVDELAHDPAIFAFIVGVMCDVFSELQHLQPRRTAIPVQLLQRHNLDLERLLEIRGAVHAPQDFENLMLDLALFARTFYDSGVAKLTQAAAHLSPEAIRYLDEFLDHYKVALKELTRVRFAPIEFNRLLGGLEPRLLPARHAAGPLDEPPGPSSSPPQAV